LVDELEFSGGFDVLALEFLLAEKGFGTVS
jgi:hypothetical protein